MHGASWAGHAGLVLCPMLPCFLLVCLPALESRPPTLSGLLALQDAVASDLARATGMVDAAAAANNRLNKIVQLTGFSDPIYAEAYVTGGEFSAGAVGVKARPGEPMPTDAWPGHAPCKLLQPSVLLPLLWPLHGSALFTMVRSVGPLHALARCKQHLSRL